ncbi:hypothetical protein B484DRAFT_397247 [Ochromonadaceae sp. CCMP2298]|nr:hypothetical protein B484DRAFT_397247 [Ochromonadaceae sp. CCMP2298]
MGAGGGAKGAVGGGRGGKGGGQAAMLLAPLDSQNFAENDYEHRLDIGWNCRCLGVESTLVIQSTTYVKQLAPRERTQRVGNESTAWVGLGCAAEQLAQHLVRGGSGSGGGWTYAHLPLDALRSMVFQAPSPTRCAAQGGLWLDHPCSTQAGCLSHLEALRLLRGKTAVRPVPGNESPYLYDWAQFHAPAGSQVCLRLSQFGFHEQKCRGSARA